MAVQDLSGSGKIDPSQIPSGCLSTTSHMESITVSTNGIFPFLDGDVPRSPSYGVYISQLIRFARVCSNIDNFNNRNLFLTAKLLKQGYRYHKIRKAFSKFYYRHSELIVKYNIGLKTLLQQGISEPIFYGDLVYKIQTSCWKT